MDEQTIFITATILTAVLGIVGGSVAFTKFKATLEAVKKLMKNFLLALQDGKLTKEEIEALIEDGKEIGDIIAGREEKKEEDPKEESSEEQAAPKKASKKSAKKSKKS